jgi:murein DD-endopeptidase MepM/ murein hydrolase activator NlpD
MHEEMKQDTIPVEEAREQVARACRRLGLLHIAFADVLVEELGRVEGRKLAAKAIKEYGRLIGEEKKKRALEREMDLAPESFRSLSDLPSFGMHDFIEEVEVGGERRIRAHGCVMGKVWKDLGKDELGGIYCLVDPASSMAFNPDYKLVHIKALPSGDPYCELVIRPSTEEDKAEFAAGETDWGVIEGDPDQIRPRSRILGWLDTHGTESSSVVGRESGRPSAPGFGHVSPLELSKASLHVFDLSRDSSEFPRGPDPEDAEEWTSLLFGRMEEMGAEVGVGRYDEVRQWYTSDIFRVPGSDPLEWRTIHMGIDLFLHPGTPVLSPFDAVVHSTANNVGSLDYGPTVILQHEVGEEVGRPIRFWTLFGHLAQEEVADLQPGQALRKGQPFARIGNFPVNGNWAPHLHFQVITDLLKNEGNFPGVALPSERARWKILSPDPNLILGIPNLNS